MSVVSTSFLFFQSSVILKSVCNASFGCLFPTVVIAIILQIAMIHYIQLAFSSIDVICSGNFVVGWFSRSGVPLHFFTNNRNFKVLPKSFNKMTKIAPKIVCQLLVFHLWFFVILSDNHILVFTVLKYIIYKQYICSLNFVLLCICQVLCNFNKVI